MSLQISIDGFGRIVLPKKLRENLGLEPGALLEVEEMGGEIRLKPIHGEPGLRRKGDVLVYTGKPTGKIEDAVRAHREGRIKKLRSRASR